MADAKAKSDSDESESPLVAWLAAVPILSGECVSVPIWAARRWLQGGIGDLLADVEGSVEPMEDKPYRGDVAAFVLSTDSGPVATETLSEITPGCTIVVPCEYGGLTLQTWSGQLGKAPAVTDIAEVVSRASERSRTVLRLDAECALGPEPPRPIKDAGDEDSAREDVKIWLQTSVESAGNSLPVVENMLRDWRQTELVEIDFGDGAWYVIHGPKPGTSELIDEDDGASFTATAAPLRTHLSGVGEWARCFADDLGLPSLIASDLVLAGRLHDVGKADPRFQAWLLDGVIGAELVAKSRTSQRSATARRDARRSSNYPKGTRHELMSVAMIQDCDALRAQSSDWDLVCHLVAAHHGRCRPFAPVVRDKRPIRVTIDEATVGRDLQAGSLEAMSNHDLALVSSPIAVRYHSLTAKYGWYDLAYLEALLRLADHRRSEWEQHQTASAEVDHA